jgi:uncharacterized protein (TIGR02217 family)
MSQFDEILFPVRLAFGSGAGIERRIDITTLASGFERRISPWSQGRRRYLIGAGIKSLADAAALLAFFEAREGRLKGFRFKDFSDFKSCALSQTPNATDQVIGTGNGLNTQFQLKKTYGTVARIILKPVNATVKVAIGGVAQTSGFSVDHTTGLIGFTAAPPVGAVISAGFEFDTPVRFDSERIDITLEGFDAGRVAAVSLVEIRI